jgi:hypothetical protein
MKFKPSLIEQSIIDGKFMLKYIPNINFAASDTEEKFQDSLRTMPDNWYYRTHPIHYNVNSEGYRTIEFDQINWGKSIVIIGCSNVFGVGLETEHTIPAKLSELLSTPVINLGHPGSSIAVALHNNVILKENYPKPLGVINLWTHHSRCVYYSTELKHFTHAMMEQNNYMDLWNRDAIHARVNALIMSKAVRLLWSNTPYTDASIHDDTADIIGCEFIPADRNARDQLHPGIDSASHIAQVLSNKLKEQL